MSIAQTEIGAGAGTDVEGPGGGIAEVAGVA
jgi:hypothetical protein